MNSKIQDMTNEELIKELEAIHQYFYDFKGCAKSKLRLRTLERIKLEMLKRMK